MPIFRFGNKGRMSCHCSSVRSLGYDCVLLMPVSYRCGQLQTPSEDQGPSISVNYREVPQEVRCAEAHPSRPSVSTSAARTLQNPTVRPCKNCKGATSLPNPIACQLSLSP